MAADDSPTPLSDGLVMEAPIPLSWEPLAGPAPLGTSARNGRLLRVALLSEEHGHERNEEEGGQVPELLRLEYKVDLLLELMAELLAGGQGGLPPRQARLGPKGIAWLEPEAVPAPGERLLLQLRPDPALPAPLVLPARVSGVHEGEGGNWVTAPFEAPDPAVAEGLERLVFRHHRRQVARMKRGADG
ncbi:MAG TPA: hypothetical protein ENI96_07360 [Sedimenticola thiotaurini]|uniref:Cyclic di-GMP receptor atypical PilZ domain-containing protein n=1 Tax=Sedimenticola thiotaurini TaxID=1543721 RepID=A0A831WAK0_9GAMM|nr:hypothetical protein [Sedimenticola thiotaurini]